MTGVCTSLCQSNIDDLLTEQWVDRLIDMGVMYTWYHVFRPVGPDASPELVLTPEQTREARQFVVDMRCKKPIIFIDAYYDADGQALCPAATGFTHHINPWGDIEPCPVIQIATESIHDSRPLDQVFNESDFLRDFRKTAAADMIPEKSWAYRIAKKIAYHDYGVYEEHFIAEGWADPELEQSARVEANNRRGAGGSDLVQLK